MLAWLEQMAKNTPRKDEPDQQADQFARIATVPTDTAASMAMLPPVWEAIRQALPVSSDCPAPQLTIRPAESDR